MGRRGPTQPTEQEDELTPGVPAGTVPRVSCVIPTHDRPGLLAEAVDSATRQCAALVEVLAVDDSGDDRARAVVASAPGRGKSVRYLHNVDGQGASSSRNLGAEQAGGDWLAFLDDDDLWLDGYLEAALAALQADPADAVFTQLDWFAGAGRPLSTRLRAQDVLARNPGVSGSNILIRRSSFLAMGGFDDQMWVSNDKDFLVRMLDAGLSYTVVPEPLVHWRTHDASRLTRPSQRRIEGLRRYYLRYRSRLSLRNRARLLGVLHDNQRRMRQPLLRRVGHLVAAVGLLGPQEYVRRYRIKLRVNRMPPVPPRVGEP